MEQLFVDSASLDQTQQDLSHNLLYEFSEPASQNKEDALDIEARPKGKYFYQKTKHSLRIGHRPPK